ncbi:helix-turn-helix domain-containing protein [Streptomyces galbus]|uniref:helix-turn-helix domain-containing protein n=1 Tax=Streptomyces galbus TaxID=33898 RepID=UPI0037F2A479
MPTLASSSPSPEARDQGPVVQPGQRLTGALAEAFSAYVVSLYAEPDPMSISAISEKTGRSQSNIHRILNAAKVTMRYSNRGYQRPSRNADPRKAHQEDDVAIRGTSADTRSSGVSAAEARGNTGRST